MACCEPESEREWLRRGESTGRGRLVRNAGGEKQLEADYDVLAQLGQGGFGSVRLAKHRLTGLLRAIKEIAPKEEEDDGYVLSRLVEVEALMQLDHPFITKLFASYQTPIDLCFLLEYVPGGELSAIMREVEYKV